MPRLPRSHPAASAAMARFGLLLLVALIGAAAVGGGAIAAPGARWSQLIVTRGEGVALSQPAPFQQEAAAGPWKLTVLEVVTGGAASDLVTGASDANEPPADGAAYVAVRLRAQNAGSRPLRIDGDDFAIGGTDGLVQRFVGAVPPDPALDGVVDPGATLEGWVVGGAAAGDANLVLVYDSVTLSGNWADATLALADGAAIPAAAGRAVKANRIGRDPGDPAGLGTQVATSDWVVELTDVVTGADAASLFPSSDLRTTALLGSDPANSTADDSWIAFKVTITNNSTGDRPGFLSPTAFSFANADGSPAPDFSTLTPPSPDAAGSYAPGASRSGWILFDRLATGGVTYDGALLRFLPYRTDDDPRYITWGGSETNTGTPAEPAFTGTLPVGAKVTTVEDGVRLRDKPSTDGGIVAELTAGVALTVTGPLEEGSGFTWYPVKDEQTGDTGYVVQQFIAPKA